MFNSFNIYGNAIGHSIGENKPVKIKLTKTASIIAHINNFIIVSVLYLLFRNFFCG